MNTFCTPLWLKQEVCATILTRVGLPQVAEQARTMNEEQITELGQALGEALRPYILTDGEEPDASGLSV